MCLDGQAEVTWQTASLDTVMAEITRRSALADLGETDPTADITALLNAGMLSQLTDACLPGGATAAQGARLWVKAAAQVVTGPGAKGAGPFDDLRVLLARQAIETACQQAIALAEHALDTATFVRGDRIDLIGRDLAVFLRQADMDNKMQRTAKPLMRPDMILGDM